jgi:hypothetical protein
VKQENTLFFNAAVMISRYRVRTSLAGIFSCVASDLEVPGSRPGAHEFFAAWLQTWRSLVRVQVRTSFLLCGFRLGGPGFGPRVRQHFSLEYNGCASH